MESPIKRFIDETVVVYKKGKDIGPREIIFCPGKKSTVFLTFEPEPGKIIKKIILCWKSLKLGKTSEVKSLEDYLVAKGKHPTTTLSAVGEDDKFILYYAPLIPIFRVKKTSTTPEFMVYPRGKNWDYRPMKKSTIVLPI